MLPCLVSVLHFKYRCAKILKKKSVAKKVKVSALLLLAELEGSGVLGPNFLPIRLTGALLPRFTTKRPSRAIERCSAVEYDSSMVHVTWYFTIFSSSRPRIL